MASLVFLFVLYCLILRFFGSGEIRTENGCGRDYYAQVFPRTKHHQVRKKKSTANKDKYVCRLCGKCMDGLQTIAPCTGWADTECGRCIYEGLGFVFDDITKSCQHPDVLSGEVAPGDIWKKLGLMMTTTPESSSDTPNRALISINFDLPAHRSFELTTATKTTSESAEHDAFALTFFGSAIILSLSLFVLMALSCQLKVSQDGVHSLFPCIVYNKLKRICFTRTPSTTYMAAVTDPAADASSSNRRITGNIMQQSKDSKFPLSSTSLYQLRTFDSLPLFLPYRSNSCHNLGYGVPIGLTLPWHTPGPVDFYIGDTGRVSRDSNAFHKLMAYDSSVISDTCTSCDVSNSDVSVSVDEYGAWKAFDACRSSVVKHLKLNDEHNVETEVYLPSVTSV